MRKILFLLPLLAVAALPTSAEKLKDNAQCERNPVFKKFTGEYLGSCERLRFKDLELWRWKKADQPNLGEEAFKVEGEYWYYFNAIEADAKGLYPSKIEVSRNFANAVKQAKGTILLQDTKNVTYVIKRPDGEFWGQAGCGRGGEDCSGIMHKIVRIAAMQQSVVVSADQIAESILDEGKALFYGLYFDTDKAALKPASAPTLAEMAKWLKNNPKFNVFIVGHTDMQGTVEHNLSLSSARGAAVVDALVKQHGIPPQRLTPIGMGPYCPVSNNTGEAGRAKNRRVEMVLR